MNKYLTILLAVMPTYVSVFCTPVWATIVMASSTILAVIITGKMEDDKELIGIMRLVWSIHLTGILLSITLHNTIL
jgi:hypothetical protein